MGRFQTASGRRLRSTLPRNLRKEHGAHAAALIDRWLDANELSDLGDDFKLNAIRQIRFPFQQRQA